MAKEHFVRSEDYRTRYIADHPGWRKKWYMCPYCGRFVTRDKMQVDHIISIDLANRQPLYRWLVPKEGINSEKNLTAACEKCNLKKSNRGGWWIVRAKLGHGWYALMWVLLIMLTMGTLTAILCGALTPHMVLAWFGTGIMKLVFAVRRYVDQLLDIFLRSLREFRIL
ncbi:MAG TPA: hypothetical protein DCL51_09785 [Ruthenibacterium lactatiformans]|nr:hypothetical protein [Ruthenibacterium lactatiformans]